MNEQGGAVRDSFPPSSARTRPVRPALAVVLVGLAVLLASWTERGHPWVDTHWLFSWSDGFVKRGLVGSVFFSVVDEASRSALLIAQYGAVILAAAALMAVTARALGSAVAASAAPVPMAGLRCAVLAAFLLAAPGLIQQTLYDFGRFDVFGIVLLSAAFVAVRSLGRTPAFAICVLVGAVGILIHEGFFFWIGPAALALWLDRWHMEGRSLIWVAGGVGFLAVVTAIQWHFNYERLFDFETAEATLQARAGFEIDPESIAVHYRGVADSVAVSMERVLGLRNLTGLALGLALIAAQAALLLSILGPAGKRPPFIAAALVALVCAPLALILAGHDMGRWLAMTQCALTFLFLGAAVDTPDLLARLTEPRLLLLLALTIVFLLLGPFGVVRPFPDAGVWAFLDLFAPA